MATSNDEEELDLKTNCVLDKEANQNQVQESYTNGDLIEEEAKLMEELDRNRDANHDEDSDLNIEHVAAKEADMNNSNRRLEEEAAMASALAISKAEKEWAKRWKQRPKDNSDATFALLRRWDIPMIPPENIIPTVLIEQCSKAIRKQLTEDDVSGEEEQSKLVLSKSQVEKKFLPLLEESEISRGKDGINVPVYGPNGKVYEMKMWANGKTADLTTEWRRFVGDYELKEICDFVTIWMFRHKEKHQICLAIDCTRLSLRYQVTKKISKSVFDDSD